MQSPGPVPKPRVGGDAGHTILQAFLFFFSLTSFITLILTAIAAANYNKTLSAYIIKRQRDYPHDEAQDLL
ncbi:hypothetical protein LB507_005872 [Fusarium sp. FIESC RH6]|nr:hypothetical protein LB507_005872 [Fusarium sp. FIESC RH6]